MKRQLAEFAATVYRFLLRTTGDVHLAEDLTQETMLRAWKAQDQLRDPDRMRVWLLRIANNVWYDHQRKKKRVNTYQNIPDSIAPFELSHEYAIADREQVSMALAAMRELPQRQREVLHLAACEQLTLNEIAEILSIEKGTVKSNLSLARQKMRSKLRNLLPDESRRCES